MSARRAITTQTSWKQNFKIMNLILNKFGVGWITGVNIP